MFGQPQFTAVNGRLNRMFAERGTLVVVHRGQPGGMVFENTRNAVLAAERSGGDLMEMDVVRSSDGEYFMFHDGVEPRMLGITENLATFTAAEINGFSYGFRTEEPFFRIERLSEVLEALPERVVLNLDRSWRYWDELLPWLDQWEMSDRILIKTEAWHAESIETARRHATKFPIMLMALEAEQLDGLLDDPELNVVGVEFVARDETHAFCDPTWIAELRARGIFTYVNALDLGNGIPMYAGWDDTVAIVDGADAGWGPIVDRHVDVIQTDFAALLHTYLVERGVRAATPLRLS